MLLVVACRLSSGLCTFQMNIKLTLSTTVEPMICTLPSTRITLENLVLIRRAIAEIEGVVMSLRQQGWIHKRTDRVQVQLALSTVVAEASTRGTTGIAHELAFFIGRRGKKS